MPATLARLLPIALLAAACVPAAAQPGATGSMTEDGVPSTADAVPSASDVGSARDVLTYRGDAARSGRMSGPGPTGNVGVRWTFQAGAPIASQVVVVDGVVEVVSVEGVLYALDLETGSLRWQADLGAVTRASPTIAGALVLIAADDGVHAVRASDGTVAWTAPGTGPVRGTPAVVGDLAICMSTSGVATALDVHTGATRWTLDLGASDDTSVAAASGIGVVGLVTGVVVGLDLESGTVRWRTDTGDAARIGTPTIADGSVFVVTLDSRQPESGRHLAALDLATGELRWRVPSPGDQPTYSPAVANGLAISGSESRAIIALDAGTGATRWQVPAPGVVEIVTTIADDTAYSASNGGMAFALDATTGAERWRIPIKGVPYGIAVTSGLVLVGTSVGSLYAIGGADR